MKDESDENMVVSLRGASSTPVPRNRAFLEREQPRRGSRSRKQLRIIIMTVVGCVILLGAIWAGYAFFHRQPTVSTTNANAASSDASSSAASAAQSAAETTDVISRVGKLIDLPTGETPTVATVTDPSKLQGQPFFANAQAGDIVLLYTVAREAYLYDPVRNKLVEVAPITTGTSTAPTQ